jgi:hypothetical protein
MLLAYTLDTNAIAAFDPNVSEQDLTRSPFDIKLAFDLLRESQIANRKSFRQRRPFKNSEARVFRFHFLDTTGTEHGD